MRIAILHHRQYSLAFAGLAFVFVAANPRELPHVDDLVRQANAACERGAWDDAENLLTQAEERTLDPGLVAFNKGLVLWQRGDYRRAELSFRRTLGDQAISPERRSKALYNLGNTLVKQAHDRDVKRLQAAIECYEIVLQETKDDGLLQDTSHNIEVAKQLWAKARAQRPPKDNESAWDDPQDPKNPPPDPRKQPDPEQGKTESGKSPDQAKKIEPNLGKDQGHAPKEVEKPVPGQGNLPVLPDTDDVQSLSPEDADALLKRAAERLQRERRKLREEGVLGERPRANDW